MTRSNTSPNTAFHATFRTISRHAHYIVFTIALLSTLISLYFSDILHWPPCNLCWYTRILMYPLIPIIGLGILRRETAWLPYVLPLTIAGQLLTAYHSLLQWGVIPDLTPCVNSVPCATKYLNLFGFITIPFLGFIAFAGINVCLYLYWKETKRVA